MHVNNYNINFTKRLFNSDFATVKQMFLNVSLLKSQVISSDGVIINFMCLLDWAMECPDTWLNYFWVCL